jgi:ABC-type nickel/cobalt efflux system permease component RcnA
MHHSIRSIVTYGYGNCRAQLASCCFCTRQAARFRKLVARGLAAAAGALCLVFLAVWALLRVELYFAGGAWAPVVGAWLTVEALFAAWMLWYHIPHFNKQPQPHKPAHNDPVLHFRRLVAHAHFLRDSCGQPVDW